MLAAESKIISEEEYLEIESKSEIKHEYHDGEMFAMAGASENHNLILSNIISQLVNKLKKRCRIYPSDMKLKIKNLSKFVYPDVTIVCGERKFFDDSRDILIDADVIIEILSDSTEAYDRGDKFRFYRKLDSFKEYLLISQKEKRIEKFFKTENGLWKISEASKNQPEIILESIDCKLNLDDIYENIF